MCKVVHHDGAVEVCDGGICTVLLTHEGFPTFGVHGISFDSRVPEINSTGCAPVLRENIDLTDKTSYALYFGAVLRKIVRASSRVMGLGNLNVVMAVIIQTLLWGG